jgi:hypothetical protein
MDDSSKLSLPSPNTIEISQEKDKLRWTRLKTIEISHDMDKLQYFWKP